MGVDGANEVYNEIVRASRLVWAKHLTIRGSPPSAFAALNQRPGEIVQRESDHENGEVFLMGLVTEREAKAAAILPAG